MQTGGLTEIQQAVRDQFQEGGSSVAALLVILALAAVVLAAYLVALRQRQTHALTTRADPRRLFNDLVIRLNLTPPQRGLLDAVAKAQDLKHPAVMLLSPALFDRCVEAWRATPRPRVVADGLASRAELVAETRAVLFP